MWTPNSALPPLLGLPHPSRRVQLSRLARRLPVAIVLWAAAALLWVAAPAPVVAATGVTGSGHAAADTRRPGDFDAIEISGGMDLVVRSAPVSQVALTADDNVLPLIETVVEDGRLGRTLKIRYARGQLIRVHTPVKAVVDAVRLRAIASIGSGDVHVERFDTPSLALTLSGSSDARLDALRTDALTVEISGSGDIQAAGRAGRVTLSISGSGDADLAALEADDVEVAIAGSGDASVHAARSLKVGISGSGDVTYRGGATRVTSSIAGSGSVNAR
jgi:hypothetical protein